MATHDVKWGPIIKEIRKTAGFTQIEFAKALHVSQSAVSKFEHDLLTMDVNTFVRLYQLTMKRRKLSLRLTKILKGDDYENSRS